MQTTPEHTGGQGLMKPTAPLYLQRTEKWLWESQADTLFPLGCEGGQPWRNAVTPGTMFDLNLISLKNKDIW